MEDFDSEYKKQSGRDDIHPIDFQYRVFRCRSSGNIGESVEPDKGLYITRASSRSEAGLSVFLNEGCLIGDFIPAKDGFLVTDAIEGNATPGKWIVRDLGDGGTGCHVYEPLAHIRLGRGANSPNLVVVSYFPSGVDLIKKKVLMQKDL